jgi:glyoxylase-like metal-dependent hydrolase (beta-lactamase superfamily II)
VKAAEAIAPGVRRLLAPNPGMMTGPGTNTWLLGDAEVVVVDPGPDVPRHLDAIRAAAGEAPIVGIWLTHAHPDHATAVGPLVAATGAAYAAWPTPAPTYPIPGLPAPTRPLAGGDRLEVDGQVWEAIHAPGHASDHLCFFRPADGLLLTGDVVVGQGTVVIAPPDGDLRAYLASLDALAGKAPRMILPGHGGPIRDPAAKLAEYKAHRLHREAQVVAQLEAGLTTIDAIVAAIYHDSHPALHPVAAKQVHGHLLKLAAEGRAAEAGGAWRPTP